ncbi:MAG: LytR C-terminal domain-containing protein [Candidatus Moraniibacteriota bacterium]
MKTPKETKVTQGTSASAIPSSGEELTAAPASVPDAPTVGKASQEPNEAFLGSLLLFCLVLSLIAATGYFGFAGYRYFKQTRAEQAIPSIDSLPRPEVPVAIAEPKGEVKPSEAPAATEQTSTVDKKTLVVKVLNGGSAKGVAGAYAEKLKAAGFAKTTIGNSFGSYTGQTLYYAKGQEAGSKVLKEEIVKTYPALTVKEALPTDKDAAAATFVLILGR